MYKMYSCLITHKPTNTNWVVYSYAKSPEDALKNKRLTWQNKSLWGIEVKLDEGE